MRKLYLFIFRTKIAVLSIMSVLLISDIAYADVISPGQQKTDNVILFILITFCVVISIIVAVLLIKQIRKIIYIVKINNDIKNIRRNQ
jgi:hypothetical protein